MSVRLLTESGLLLAQENGAGDLLVEPAPLYLTVLPYYPSIRYGATQQFTASATYPDLTTTDITTLARWSVKNPATGTITPTGFYSELGGDDTSNVIIAAYGGTTTSTFLQGVGRGALLSQYVAETLVQQRGASARASQVALEVLVGARGAKLSQYVAEALVTNAAQRARASQVVLEVLASNP